MMDGMEVNSVNVTNQVIAETPVPVGPAQKSCALCGEMFVPPRKNSKKKLCGVRCKNQALGQLKRPIRAPDVPKTCLQCGETFYVQRFMAAERAFCGTKCAGLHRRVRELRSCATCGAEFRAYPSQGASYCSRKCAREGNKGEKNKRWKSAEMRPCMHCGTPFNGAKGWQKSKRFCSRKCVGDYKIKHGGSRAHDIGTVAQYADGYRYVKVAMRKWVPEHRVIAERSIGRPLKRHELVHHKNGKPTDNRPENLQVVTVVEHRVLHREAERIGLLVMAGELEVVDPWMPEVEGMMC